MFSPAKGVSLLGAAIIFLKVAEVALMHLNVLKENSAVVVITGIVANVVRS
jgi:microcompartment protein CcmL/EutN